MGGALSGFLFPRSPTGRSSLLPPPPWHYSGEMLTVEYRTDPDAVAELLPAPLAPAPEEPDAVAVIWADWQSCSDGGEELLDPVRAQYRECFFVVRCTYAGELYSRCVYIWVDTDLAMVRGHVQGYPKKLGQIHLTRPVTVGRAGPRLAPGGRFGATCSAAGRRLVEATFEITGPGRGSGFVNAHPMLHHRWMPAVEADGRDALDELVVVRSEDVEVADEFAGTAELRIHDSPTEELTRLAPRELLGAHWKRVAATFRSGTTVERGEGWT